MSRVMGETRSAPSYLRCVGLGLFASPAAVVWALTRDDDRPARRALRWGTAAAVLSAALLLLASRLRFDLLAAAWGAFCLIASLLAAALLPGRVSVGETPDLHPWSRKTLRAVIPLTFLMPCLGAVAGLVGWLLVGGFLARLNPDAIDPREAVGLLILDSFWLIPCGILFAAASLRRGHFGRPSDLFAAAAAWTVFLVLRQALLQGGFGALNSQKIGAEGFDEWNQWQAWVFHTSFIAAAVPVTLYLAWGPRRWRSRLAAVALLLAAATVNLAVLVGANSRVAFVTARILERSGKVPAALSWYGRALEVDSDPALASYLQHRIGLLHYKLGNLERARAAFRLLTTTRDANAELVGEGRYYLERLASGAQGERRVLPGVEVPVEMRDAYCAPNTLALAFRFLGRPVNVSELGDRVTLLGVGTSGSDIRFLADEYGFEHHLVPFATLDDVRWLVDRGLPALLYRPGHVLAVFGYDDRLGTAVAFDTSRWDIWVDRPYPDLEREWGQWSFLLGVVLPREGGSPAVAEARKRFAGPRSRAAWHWWLYREDYDEAHLRQAVLADPTFSLAVFDLLDRGGLDDQKRRTLDWIERHADVPAVLSEARRLLGREHADAGTLAHGLARWYAAKESWPELARLSAEMSRRRLDSAVSPEAGVAAGRLGDWQRAAFLLESEGQKAEEDEDGDYDLEALSWLLEAQRQLGRKDAAADTLLLWTGYIEDDGLDRALEVAAELAGGQGPGFLERVYQNHLYSRPEDAQVHLRLAEVSLAAARELPEQRQDRLQWARRAATLARAMAPDAGTRERATALLAEQRRLASRR